MTVSELRQEMSFWQRYRDFLLSRNTILAFLGLILLLFGFFFMATGQHLIADIIFLASAIIGGLPLFILAGKRLILHRDITVGVMASVAMIAAIIVGEFEAAALVVFMMSIGEWMEDLTVARSNNALRELASLIPPTVTVRRDGAETVVSIDEVTLNDIVLVRTGERIGVDGTVVTGNGSVNQAAITGESMPVEIEKGDQVFAGSINELGTLEISVDKLGDETTLGQIVILVKNAQASKAPVERTANRYARYLVPATFVLAAIVGLATGDVMRSVTILVVVCPCALVLATPTAVMAAIGNAAKYGILVKSGTTIEQAGKVDVVAFDKTGTLTHGKPEVKEVISLNGIGDDEFLNIAASAERFSEHPIGRAIVKAAEMRQVEMFEPVEFQVLPGFGVKAHVDGQSVCVGKQALLIENGVAWPEDQNTKINELEGQGYTVISVGIADSLAGYIALADAPREEAKAAISELKAMGIKELIMITGDNERVAKLVADELGVDRYFADVMPQDKLDIIRGLQTEGYNVAFAGDGVNDAPALAAADVGIAMGVGGTDVALETADVGLMQDEINRIPQLIHLSRKALIVIRQNIIFSMSMNLFAVVLSTWGIIGPVIGAILHETSSLPVLANSARLVDMKYKKPTEKRRKAGDKAGRFINKMESTSIAQGAKNE